MFRDPTQRRAKPGINANVVLSLLAAAHLAVVVSILVQDRPIIWPLHNDTIHRMGRGADFNAVYHAGVNLRHGGDPYANNFDGVTPYWFPFRYLPVVAIAAQPLTLLPPQTAYILWVLVLEGLLALLLFVMWKRIDDAVARCAAIGILLLNSTYFLELYMGQFTFASVTLLYLGFVLPAGQILFSLSVLLKPLTLVTIPALVLQRRYWSHVALAVLCVVLLSVPYFAGHPDQWSVFVDDNLRPEGGLDTGNYGFVRFLQLMAEDTGISFFPRHWGACVGVLRTMALAATALVVLFAKKRSVIVGACALLLAHFLTYQHVWEHHMSGVCVVGAAVLTVADRRKSHTAIVLLSLLLLALPTPFGLLDSAKDPKVWDPSAQWPRYTLYLLVLSKVVPTVALFVTSIAYIRQEGFMPPRLALRSIATKTSDPPAGRRRSRKR